MRLGYSTEARWRGNVPLGYGAERFSQALVIFWKEPTDYLRKITMYSILAVLSFINDGHQGLIT